MSVKIWETLKPRTRWCRSLWRSGRRALGECHRGLLKHFRSDGLPEASYLEEYEQTLTPLPYFRVQLYHLCPDGTS